MPFAMKHFTPLSIARTVAVAAIIAPLIFTACDLLGPERGVTVSAPELPDTLREAFGATSFMLVVDGEEIARLEKGETRTVRIPAGGPVAVQAYPVVGERIDVIRPAGAIVAGRNDAEVPLEWADGVLAEIAARLQAGGVPLAAVNVWRLAREIRERAGTRQWSIDVDAVVEALANEVMNVRLLEPRGGAGVEVPVGGDEWVAADALRPEAVPAIDGSLVLANLAPGVHVYGRRNGDRRVRISVGDSGQVGWIFE